MNICPNMDGRTIAHYLEQLRLAQPHQPDLLRSSPSQLPGRRGETTAFTIRDEPGCA